MVVDPGISFDNRGGSNWSGSDHSPACFFWKFLVCSSGEFLVSRIVYADAVVLRFLSCLIDLEELWEREREIEMLRARAFRQTNGKIVKIQVHPTHPWLVTADDSDHVSVWNWEHRQVCIEILIWFWFRFWFRIVDLSTFMSIVLGNLWIESRRSWRAPFSWCQVREARRRRIRWAIVLFWWNEYEFLMLYVLTDIRIFLRL